MRISTEPPLSFPTYPYSALEIILITLLFPFFLIWTYLFLKEGDS